MCAKSEGLIHLKPPAMGGENEAKNGRDVDRVAEGGGPATIGQSLLAVRYGAEIASIGFLSTENPGVDFFSIHSQRDWNCSSRLA